MNEPAGTEYRTLGLCAVLDGCPYTNGPRRGAFDPILISSSAVIFLACLCLTWTWKPEKQPARVSEGNKGQRLFHGCCRQGGPSQQAELRFMDFGECV